MEETIRVVIKKPYQPAYEDNIKNDLHTFYKIIKKSIKTQKNEQKL